MDAAAAPGDGATIHGQLQARGYALLPGFFRAEELDAMRQVRVPLVHPGES